MSFIFKAEIYGLDSNPVTRILNILFKGKDKTTLEKSEI